MLKLAAGRSGSVRALPLMNGWFVARNFPAPEGKTFHEQWKTR
jgi:L-lactate dehydrogenase complex protein LldF